MPFLCDLLLSRRDLCDKGSKSSQTRKATEGVLISIQIVHVCDDFKVLNFLQEEAEGAEMTAPASCLSSATSVTSCKMV